jgi:AraC-like DNA-binding protein
VLSGEGYYNGRPVHADEGFLVKPTKEAKYFPSPQNPWNYFWISFHGTASDEICQKHIITDDGDIFSYDFRAQLTDFIRKLFSSEDSLEELQSLSYFYEIISRHKAKSQTGKNRYVEEAKNFVNLNFHRQLSVRKLADMQKINDRYLYNLFIKYEGISPKEYISDIRIQNAKLLLKKSDCSVSEVAASVGFPDVLTFSRFFKKRTGLSPRKYKLKLEKY